MPLPEKYRRHQAERHRLAEVEARRDTRLAWARVFVEIIFWTVAGLGCIGLAFHTFDFELAPVYWWTGFVVWTTGVSVAVLSAYRRGRERGDW